MEGMLSPETTQVEEERVHASPISPSWTPLDSPSTSLWEEEETLHAVIVMETRDRIVPSSLEIDPLYMYLEEQEVHMGVLR